MENVLGEALARFEERLGEVRAAVGAFPGLAAALFEDTDDWSDLLTYKLVPHLSGEGCLVAAVCGGTNTGKSTVFNMLLGREVSSIMMTAAATCHPVLAGDAVRCAECLEGKLVPEFAPLPLSSATDATDQALPTNTLLVATLDSLPHHLVIMDTPDVDSIDKRNWDVADHIRAAGDVLVAIVTGEKYKDERVVAFFREAVASGRIVLPVMNKANPADEFHVARRQLDEFRNDTGAEAPGFAIPHDFDVAKELERPIAGLDGDVPLRAYLETLDVPAIKERVFRTTVNHFAQRAEVFLSKAEGSADRVRDTIGQMESRARATASQYDPMPGAEVGGLFHEFVQSKRGAVRRTIGTASARVAKGITTVGRRVSGALARRATLDGGAADVASSLHRHHHERIERIVRDFSAECLNTAHRLAPPYDEVLVAGFDALSLDDAVQRVAEEVLLGQEDVSQNFRAHARRTLDAWWEDHRGKRRVLEALDILLAIMPAAIAAPISVYTGGVGASEAVVIVGPIASQFVTRVMEYQFGDAMFDFLSPWKKEQQAALARAIEAHLLGPALAPARAVGETLHGEVMTDMKRRLRQCLTVS